MARTKSTETIDPYKSLANFYKRKLEDQAGGSMFQIQNKGRILRTMWGRSKAEVERYLNKTRDRFDKIIELSP